MDHRRTPKARQHKHNILSGLSFYIECLVEIALEEKTKAVQSVSDILILKFRLLEMPEISWKMPLQRDQ